ncbi:MAG: hypothetical protein IT314_03235 [Anaerolineales bacterium]|nr:hypothetical protein [Anaerolineales bacterium]
MKPPFQERRDLVFLVLLVLLGVPLMLAAGQLATRFVSNWKVKADISSHVDTGLNFDSNAMPYSVAPVRAEILTPMGWADSFLDPQTTDSETSVVPLVVLDPSATPTGVPSLSPTPSPTASPTSTPPTVTATPSPSAMPSAFPTATATKPPKEDDPEDSPPPATASPTLPPVTSTIDPAMTQIVGAPPGLNMGDPDGNSASGNNFPDGSFIVLDMSSNPIVVNATPDGNYDLVFYEDENPNGSGQIAMDQVSLGITNDPSGSPYYEVFNWGDGIPDVNTNVDTAALGLPTAEVDNQTIPTSDLYEDPASSPPPANSQTGILIDVDQAPSHPPPGSYQYIVILAPPATNPNNAGDDGQADSVQVTEVSSPAPP